MVDLRRLRLRDESLIRAAWEWDRNAPRWYREMDRVFSRGSVDDLISQLSDKHKVFIGIFDPDLTAVIIIDMKAEGQFEGHLLAKPHTNADLIVPAIIFLTHDLIQFGMREISVWVAERNFPVRRICERANLKPDGVVMFRGAYWGRVIRWIRHSLTREDLDAQTDIEYQTAVFQPSDVFSDSARV